MTLADIIELYSEYRVGSASTDDITDAQLATLKTNAETRLYRLIGARSFAANEIEEMTAWLVLDVLSTRHGKGVVVQESVKDDSWRVKDIISSSAWMDKVIQKIGEYDSGLVDGLDLGSTGDIEAGVRRNDDLIPELMDGFVVPDEEDGW